VHGVQLQHWNAAEKRWEYAGGGRDGHWRIDDDGLIHAFRLEAGSCRFVQTESRTASDPVNLGVGESKTIELDLTRERGVSGRVLAPKGVAFHEVSLDFDGAPPDLSPGWPLPNLGYSVGEDGTFSIRVPGDRAIALRALHPLLECPSPVRIARSRDDVILTLVRAPTAFLRCAPQPNLTGYLEADNNLDFARHLGIYLMPGRHALQRTWGKKVIEFRVRPGSTRGLLLDLPGLVPKRLTGLEFGAGRTDLGVIRFERGTTIRVEVDLPEGRTMVRTMADATKREPDPYMRRGHREGPGVCLIRGLGRGTFLVSVRVVSKDHRGDTDYEDLERAVEVSGAERDEVVRIEMR